MIAIMFLWLKRQALDLGWNPEKKGRHLETTPKEVERISRKRECRQLNEMNLMMSK